LLDDKQNKKNGRPTTTGMKPKAKEIRGSTRPIGGLEKKQKGLEGRRLMLISQ
jgi:hypothetical protein